MKHIEHLSSEDQKYLDAHYKWVENWLAEGKEGEADAPEGKLKLIQNIIDYGEIDPNETVKLQALGNYFGYTLCQYTGWKIQVFEDEYGRDLSIKLPNKKVWLHPTTMISKRVEDGQPVDIFEIFSAIIYKAKEVAEEAGDG